MKIDFLLICAAHDEWRSLAKKIHFTRYQVISPFLFFKADHEKNSVMLTQIGIGMTRAQAQADFLFQMVDSPQKGVIHFGFSTALKEGVSAGMLVIPDKIIDPTGASLTPSPELRGRAKKICEERGLPFIEGPLFTADKILTTPQEKKEAGQKWGAIAVDMETSPYARAALEKKIPFLSLRVIWDPLEWDITRLTESHPLKENGELNIRGLLAGIIKHPCLLRELPKYQRASLKVGQRLKSLITNLLEG